jgi:hypothetical protein
VLRSRRRAGLVSFVLAPLLAAGIFVVLVFSVDALAASVALALAIPGAVGAVSSRLAGYREPKETVGWAIGAVLASALAIVLVVVIGIILISLACGGGGCY